MSKNLVHLLFSANAEVQGIGVRVANPKKEIHILKERIIH